mgnify:CR=1 FL=1
MGPPALVDGQGGRIARKLECRPQEIGDVLDDRQLPFLIVGHEASQRHDVPYLRKGRQLPCKRGGFIQIGRQDVDRIGRRSRITREVEERRHRLHARIFQADRVEVEAEEGNGDQPGRADGERRDENRARMTAREIVERLKLRRDVATGGAQGQQRQERRQYRQVGHHGEKHPRCRDHAEFGKSPVVGRYERQKARCHHDGAQHDGTARRTTCRGERRRGVASAGHLLTIAQAKMNAEIDAETDEQNGKGDGDEVEAAHGQGCEGGRPDEPDQQGDDGDEDEPPRP